MPINLTPGQRTVPTQRGSGAPPPDPGDFGDQIADSFADARADTTGYVEQVQLDAYKPVIHALEDDGYSFTHFVNPRTGMVSPEAVWRAVDKARKQTPGAFADLPATYEEYETQWREAERDRVAQIRARTAQGDLIPGFIGGLGGGMTDPPNIYTLAVGGFGKGLMQKLLTEGLIGAGVETALQPVAQGNREKLGLPDLTAGEAAANIAFAGVGSAAFRGGIEIAPKVDAKAYELAKPIRSAIDSRFLEQDVARLLSRARLEGDPMNTALAELASRGLSRLPDIAEEQIGRENMTQAERDAVDVLRDQEETARTPFMLNGAGEELHAGLVGEALDGLLELSPVSTENFMEPTISASGRFVFEPISEAGGKAQYYVEFTPEGSTEAIKAQVTIDSEDGSAILNINTDKIEGREGANEAGPREIMRLRNELLDAFPDIRSVTGERVTGPKANTEASTFNLNEDQVTRLRSRVTRAPSNPVGTPQAEARFMERVRSAESSGDDTATNSRSSATGRYQFIDSTWIRQYVKRYGREGLTDEEILAKRTNGAIQDQLMKDLTAENAAFLRQQGEAVSEGNLYLTHFAGSGNAKKVFEADPNTPIDQVWSAEVIRANPHLNGMTAGDVITWAHRKMGQRGNSPRPGEGYELNEDATGLDAALAREAEELDAIRRKLDEAYAAQDAARREAQGQQDSEAVRSALNAEPAPRAFDDGQIFDEAAVEPTERLEEGETPEQAALRSSLVDLVHDSKQSLNDIAALAGRFEVGEDEIRGALDGMVARGTLTTNSKTGNYMRKPGSDPDELLETVARLGGLRDDEGHNLGIRTLSKEQRDRIGNTLAARRAEDKRRANGEGMGLGGIMTRGGPVLRKNGLSVDRLGEALWEEGWFPERPTERQVLELLQARTGSGKKMYRPGSERAKPEAIDPDAEENLRGEWEEAEAAFRSEYSLGKAFDGTLDDMPDEAIMSRAAEIYRDSGGEVDAETAVLKALDEEYERVLEDLALEDMEATYGEKFDIFDPEWSARLDERIAERRRADGEGGSGREGFPGNARPRGESGGGSTRSGTDAVDPQRLAELEPEQRAPFSDPDGPAAKQQADSLVHDMRAELGFYTADEIGETTTVSLPSKKKGWKGGPDAEVSVGRTPDGNWTYSLSYTLPDRGEARPFTKRDFQFSREAALRKGIFELQIKTAQAHDDDAGMIAAKNRIRKWAKEEMAKAQDAPEPTTAAPVEADAGATKAVTPAREATTETVAPPAEGMIRVYHGGAREGAGEWVSSNREYAQQYAERSGSGAAMWYVDLPKTDPRFASIAENDYKTTANFKLTEEEIGQARLLDDPAPTLDNGAQVAPHISDSVGQALEAQGFTRSGNEFTKRIAGAAPAGTVSDGTRIRTLTLDESGRYLSRMDGFDVANDVDLRRFENDPEGAIAAVMADRADPAIAARQASEAQLRADAPMRGANVTGQEQDGTMGLGLFDAADQPEFMLDADAPGKTGADLLAELDKGDADLKSIRDCL